MVLCLVQRLLEKLKQSDPLNLTSDISDLKIVPLINYT